MPNEEIIIPENANAPISELEGKDVKISQNPNDAKAAKAAQTPTQKRNRLILIIGIVLAVALLGVAGYFVYQSLQPKGDEIPEPEEITEEVEAEPLWGADEEDNSGEAYVAYQQSVISNAESTSEDIFDAQLSIANYYITVDQFTDAEALMTSLDTTNFSTEQFFRYYNVMTRLYDRLEDTTKRDEYNALATDYRNKLQAESVQE